MLESPRSELRPGDRQIVIYGFVVLLSRYCVLHDTLTTSFCILTISLIANFAIVLRYQILLRPIENIIKHAEKKKMYQNCCKRNSPPSTLAQLVQLLPSNYVVPSSNLDEAKTNLTEVYRAGTLPKFRQWPIPSDSLFTDPTMNYEQSCWQHHKRQTSIN
jgi:hypothetical protein